MEAFGFEVNPYDPCVANKMANGSQITVTWHVDDLKILHKDSGEVTKCIKYLQKIYGEKMTIHRGKVHDYLRMDLDFSSSRVLKIGMIKYIKKIHEEFPEEIKTAAATPTAEHLFGTQTTRISSFPKSKRWPFTGQQPNFCFSVPVRGRTYVRQFLSCVREPSSPMKTIGVN